MRAAVNNQTSVTFHTANQMKMVRTACTAEWCLDKLDLNSTADLVRYAVRNNIIEA